MRRIQLLFLYIIISSSILAQKSGLNKAKIFDLVQVHSGSQTYEYIARDYVTLNAGFEYNASTTGATFSAAVDETQIYKYSIDELVTSDEIANHQIDKNLDYGSIPGSFSVNSSGKASYSIPIYTPPGTNGLSPNLSVTYTSEKFIGLLGMGWYLSGLSSIHRTGLDYQHDGTTQDVKLTTADKFALDGNRLILKSGRYGLTGSTYETEYRNFLSIEAKGTSGNGPAWFEVKSQDGTVIEYGHIAPENKPQKVISGQSSVSNWFISKVTDVNGNYIKYIYKTTDWGETYLESIKYTGNNTAGLEPYNEIKILYSESSGSDISYVAGYKDEQKLIIRKIQVYAFDKKLRAYEFKYRGQYGNEFLSEVVFSNENGEQLNSTIIEWPVSQFNDNVVVANKQTSNIGINDVHNWGDFNGDGFNDYVLLNDAVSPNKYEIYINDNGTGTFIKNQSISINGTHKKLLISDYNGDGISDVVFVTEQTKNCVADPDCPPGTPGCYSGLGLYYTIDFYCGNEVNLALKDTYTVEYCSEDFHQNRWIDIDNILFSGDFDADALDDILIKGNVNKLLKGTPGMSNITEMNISTPSLSGDYFAENIVDASITNLVAYDASNYIHVYRLVGSSFQKIFDASIGVASSDISFIDCNGDGKKDIYTYDNLYIGTGMGFDSQPNHYNTAYPDLAEFYLPDQMPFLEHIALGDYDGDGMIDVAHIIFFDTHHRLWNGAPGVPKTGFDPEYEYFYLIYWRLSNGRGGSKSSVTITPGPLNSHFITNVKVLDCNGDGKEDLVPTSGFFIESVPSFSLNYVSAITNGIGLRTEIEYGNLTKDASGGLYTKRSTTPTFPYFEDYAMDVVSSFRNIATLNSNELLSEVSLQYQGATYHAQGNGFLGFEKLTTTRNDGNSSETYKTLYAPLGISYTSLVKQYYNGTPLSESTRAMSHKSFTLPGGTTYFTYSSTQTNTDKLNNNTSTTTNSYDGNCNLVSSRTEAQDGSYSEKLFANYLGVNSYNPQTITSKTKHADDYTVFSTVTKVAYSSNGQVSSKTGNFGKSIQSTTVYSNFNTFGIPLTVTTTPLGETGISVSYITDNTGRFVQSETGPLGTTSYTYDKYYGRKLSSTDMYGNTSSYSYSNWGEGKQVTDVFGNVATTTTNWADASAPSGAVFYKEVQATNSPTSRTYYNSKGQEVQGWTEGFGGTKYFAEMEYNQLGQVTKKSRAYTTEANKLWDGYEYRPSDGRIERINLATGSVSSFTYSVNQIVTTVNGQSYTNTYNALGQVKSSTNPLNSVIQHTYSSAGAVKTTTSPGGVYTSTIDSEGLVQEVTDPYMGITEFDYNSLGQVTHEKDGTGDEWDYTYDDLNRLSAKTSTTGSETYSITYVKSGNGKGQIQKNEYNDGTTISSYEYTYDSYGRILTQTKTIGSKSITLTNTYNGSGQLIRMDNSKGKYYEFSYTSRGILEGMDYLGNAIWTLTSADLTEVRETLGQAVSVTYSYDQFGFPTAIKSGNLFDMSFSFDPVKSNLTSRTRKRYNSSGTLLTSHTESFTYDALDRLTRVTGPGNSSTLTKYGSLNKEAIDSKSDVGEYVYDALKNYQLNSIDKPADELLASKDQNITYTSFNKVKTISENGYLITFTYGPNNERCMMEVKKDGALQYTRYYFGSYEETVYADNSTEAIYYFSNASGIFGFDRVYNNTSTVYYTLKDYLGSVLAIVSADGSSVIEEASYDAWGRLRNATDLGYAVAAMPSLLKRGYTSHEQIAEVNLVNMNGRVYDPSVALFLSPDPVIQSPNNALNYNRYSYVLNNPLKYTDPSGYNWDNFDWNNLGYDDFDFDQPLGGGASYGSDYELMWETGFDYMASTESGSQYVASAAVTPSGKIVGARNDDDHNIYLINDNKDLYNYLTGNTSGLDVAGYMADPGAFVGYEGKNIMSTEMQMIFQSTGGGHISTKNGLLVHAAPVNCIGTRRTNVAANSGGNWLSDAWNSEIARAYIPDRISISLQGNIAVLAGAGQDIEINLLTRGEDPGIFLTNSTKRRWGFEGDAGIQGNIYRYLGPANEITRASVLGPTRDIDGGLVFGGSIIWGLDSESGKVKWIGAGAGAGLTVGVSYGIADTRMNFQSHPLF